MLANVRSDATDRSTVNEDRGRIGVETILLGTHRVDIAAHILPTFGCHVDVLSVPHTDGRPAGAVAGGVAAARLPARSKRRTE